MPLVSARLSLRPEKILQALRCHHDLLRRQASFVFQCRVNSIWGADVSISLELNTANIRTAVAALPHGVIPIIPRDHSISDPANKEAFWPENRGRKIRPDRLDAISTRASTPAKSIPATGCGTISERSTTTKGSDGDKRPSIGILYAIAKTKSSW